MKKTARKTNAQINFFIFSLVVLLVLILASINIALYTKPVVVLGASTVNDPSNKTDSSEEFWKNFLIQNPDYVPGWIEIGRLDRAKEIDPNYFTR